MTRILIVGGGRNQVGLVNAARQAGLQVIVTDMYSNPPCRALADYFEQVDTTDRQRNLQVARAYSVTAVQTDQTDVAVPTVAAVAEELGLPGIGFEVALKFTNKELMRRSLTKSPLFKVPKFNFFEALPEALGFIARENRATLIVKPINTQGSKGVSRLVDSLSESADKVRVAFAESRGKGILLEEFVDGDEYSVEAITISGRVINLAVTTKYHFSSNPCIDVRNTYLGDVPPSLESRLFAANEAVINQLGLMNGSSHAEFMVSNGTPYLMEIAARGGGGNISGKIVPYLTGFSPSDALIQLALGKTPAVEARSYRERFAIMRFFDFPRGLVRSVEVDQRFVNSALHFELDLRPGDQVMPIHSSRDRKGYFIVTGDDRRQVVEEEERGLKAIGVEYQDQTT
jgi:biotin carboxylase